MKRKHSLKKSVMTGIVVLAVILTVGTNLIVGLQYRDRKIEDSSDLAFSYTRAAAEFIDGDSIQRYLQTNTKDPYYEEVMEFLNSFQLNTNLKYYYVFVPMENDLVYIWDAEHYEGACPLGYHEEYMVGGKEAVRGVYRADPIEEISITKDDTYGYIASAYSPVFNSAGEPVAIVGVDLSMPGLNQEIFSFLVNSVVFVAIITFLLSGIYFFYTKRNILKPIDLLHRAAGRMVENLEEDQVQEIDIHTGDEIEELASAFMQMNLEVKEYIKKLYLVTAEKERIGAELDVAAHIQSSMLPCIFPPFPDRHEFDIYATMTPAKEVGGDFYDFFMVDERHLAIVMADVSGKGVPAALFMVIGKTLIKDHTQPGADLGTVFSEVNDILCTSNSEGMFITAFEGVLDLVTGELRFVNAGHEIPFISRAGGAFEPHKIRAGFVLAGMEGLRYRAGVMELMPGDKLFQYTDGVTEATSAAKELYGMERLQNVLASVSDKAPQEILPAVKTDIDRFVGTAPQFDDITMLCLEYKARMQEPKTIQPSNEREEQGDEKI